MDFDEDDDEPIAHNRHQLPEELNGIKNHTEDNHGLINKTSSSNNTKTKLTVQDNNHNLNDQQTGGNGQEGEWEEFENSNSKYDQLRLKLSRAINEDDENNDDEDYYDENNQYTNHVDNPDNVDGEENSEQTLRNNRRREQLKDKPVWKLDQVKQVETNDLPTEKIIEEPQPTVTKPATSGAYRPPQLRGNSSVTVVSSTTQRVSKKEKPNLASTEEFPTLGAAVNKK